MKKQLSLEKNSFSLFETIFAITIIAIVIGGFLKSSNYNFTSYQNLQSIKNSLIQNDSSDIHISKFGFLYTIQNPLDVTLLNSGIHSKLIYNKNSIYLEKYNLVNTPVVLNYKVYQ